MLKNSGFSESGTVVTIKETAERKPITLRQLLIVCAALVSAYLINGEHAQAVCNVCTTIPAAIFTYKQLADHATRIFAYKATLFYWSVHGILIAFDNVFLDAFGYFFGKFILLVVLFFNVVYQYESSTEQQQQQQNRLHRSIGASSRIASSFAATSARSPAILDSWLDSKTDLHTALTLTDATQFSNLNAYRVNSPKAGSLTTALSMAPSPVMTAYSDTSYTYEASLKTVPSAEDLHKIYGTDRLSPLEHHYGEKSDDSKAKVAPVGDCQIAGDQAMMPVVANANNNHSLAELLFSMVDYRQANNKFDSLAYVGASLGQLYDYYSPKFAEEMHEELIVSPSEYIIFSNPYSEPVTIYMTNKHNSAIMWAMKTNAVKHIVAQPTCGTLAKGATLHIKLRVIEEPTDKTSGTDRIIILYYLIDDKTVAFDRTLFSSYSDPKKKKLAIYYER